MTYRYSYIDNNNIKWFTKDESKATLLSIEISRGEIRGLKNIKIEFKYPITAIAGRNGSGKTTALALAACAYHNEQKMVLNFHTEDTAIIPIQIFLYQTLDEVPPEGIPLFGTDFFIISCERLHNIQMVGVLHIKIVGNAQEVSGISITREFQGLSFIWA